jgi:hypothetical protein
LRVVEIVCGDHGIVRRQGYDNQQHSSKARGSAKAPKKIIHRHTHCCRKSTR